MVFAAEPTGVAIPAAPSVAAPLPGAASSTTTVQPAQPSQDQRAAGEVQAPAAETDKPDSSKVTAPDSKPAAPQNLPTEKPADAPTEVPALVGTEVAPAVETVIETPTIREDLWARVRYKYGVEDLDNDLVRKWEQYYIARPDYLKRMFERGGRYLFHIVEEVSRRGLPTELALLPFIESAFNPHAMSSARASGIWQFMPATGRHFELRQNLFRDDRRSVLDSTRAALDYLAQLHATFGDWQLALAAYNWGQGNVGKALANNRRAGRGTRYVDLTMPDETRNYMPKLQAIANLVQRPEQFGIELPPLENHPYFLTVNVDRDIDVALAARLAGLPLEEFQALNPQMNKPVILAAGTTQLLLPYDNAQNYQREMQQHRGPFATWTAWVAPGTMSSAEVARRVGMSEQQLREVNLIPPRMMVKAGSTLLVPRHGSVVRDVSERLADSASIQLAPEPQPARRLVLKVGPKGESVASLAQRYRVSSAQLAAWNSTSAKGAFKSGQQVVMFLPNSAPQNAKAARASKPAATNAQASRQLASKKAPTGKGQQARRTNVAVASKR